MSDVNKTIAERQSQHGAFVDQAEIAMALSEVMHRATNYRNLTAYQRESLEMIQIKISRILEGDRNHVEHWHDIAGYATLVERALLQERERLTARPAGASGGGTDTYAVVVEVKKPSQRMCGND